MTTKCKKCKNNFENPGYNPNMDLDLCPDCNLEIEDIEEVILELKGEVQWVIKYKDVKVHHHRHEVLHEDGEWYGEVGDIMTFQTKEKAQKFLNTLDSKEYDRWIEVEK